MCLYDTTSSYFEDDKCPLAAFGYNWDQKKGKMPIVIGLLADSAGRPMAVEAFTDNTNDQSTVIAKINNMRSDFGINEVIFIGDRGINTEVCRENLEAADYENVRYITALTRNELFDDLQDQNQPLQL